MIIQLRVLIRQLMSLLLAHNTPGTETDSAKKDLCLYTVTSLEMRDPWQKKQPKQIRKLLTGTLIARTCSVYSADCTPDLFITVLANPRSLSQCRHVGSCAVSCCNDSSNCKT